MTHFVPLLRPSVGVAAVGAALLALSLVVCFRSVSVLHSIKASSNSIRAIITLTDAETAGLLALVDQETGVRGYVATHNPVFLDVYRRGVWRYTLSAKRFDNSPGLDTSILTTYADVLKNSSAVEHFFKSELALTRGGHTSLAINALGEGKRLFDRYRASHTHLARLIRLQLARDRALFQRILDWASYGSWIASGLSLALGVVLAALVRASRGIEGQAQSDPLTGLANRRMFRERLDCREKYAGVMLLDLDEFKHVNDHYGHDIGDVLLKAVGRRLLATVREGDLVARIGGDEFAVVFQSDDADGALATRIRAAFDRPFNLPDDLCLGVGCSLGIGLAFKGVSGTDLFRLADERMFADKRRRRSLAMTLPYHSERRPSQLGQATLEVERFYELERSMSFRRAVLPLTLPHIVGVQFDAIYEPGFGHARVGGDWYDAVRLIDGRVLITIGDVAGSGLGAPIVGGVVRQLLRGIAQVHTDPALILDAAGRALALEYPDVHVTAWIGILDLVTRTMIYSCAGHPPPLLVSSDGRPRELSHPTLATGLREGLRGVSNTVAWSDVDTLILYTDGLSKAKKAVISGSARVYEAARQLGPAPWRDPAKKIKQFVIPDGSPDDVAILVVRVTFATYGEYVDRWHLDVRDQAAATMLRKRFTASLPARHFSADHIAAAELVFGELVGNVVRHVPEDFQIEIAVDHSGPQTVLHVIDSGRGFRYINRLAPDPYSESGRGQCLISAMTADFQVDKRAEGGSHARAVLQGRSPRPFRDLPATADVTVVA